MSHQAGTWTNPSVRLMAGKEDPIAALTHRARQLVRRAMDMGWSGPPFDPIDLADILKMPVIPRHDIRDARTVPMGQSGTRIEFNPNRPPMRVRYSIAHEIAHTLFPDCGTLIRNRAAYHEMTGDDAQLEALCNIGAAEILMPAGSLKAEELPEPTTESIIAMRRRYQVSTEALLIRLAKMSEAPRAAFCASRPEVGAVRYRLDYLIGSPGWSVSFKPGAPVPETSVVTQCVAIGFTSSGREQWQLGKRMAVECIAIPPYPGRRHPRVVGLLSTTTHRSDPLLVEVRGDALEPRSKEPRIIAHVVNDATPNWGGGGFAANLRRRYPEAQEDYRKWAAEHHGSLSLGQSHVTELTPGSWVFHMVAQHGYGPANKPRIRYAALQTGLEALAAFAASKAATVHMPRIGTGQAQGAWEVIRDMIIEVLGRRGVHSTVYALPNQTIRGAAQTTLALTGTR